MSPDQDNSPDPSVNNTPDTDSSTPDTQESPQSSPAQPPAQTQPQPQAPQAAQQAPQAPAAASTTQAQPQVSNSNTPVPATDSQHPLVRKAGVLAQVAQALAGGPHIVTKVNDDGTTSRTEVPLSKGAIGFAIALEALSGSLTGLSAQGPNAAFRGGAAAFSQAEQRVQQQKAQAEQQAQVDSANRSNAFARAASIAHTNAQTVAAVSEAEQRGQDAILKLADFNRQSGVLDADPDALDNGGQPITQSELQSRMQQGTLSSTDQLGPVAGATEVTAKDGSKHWESTHIIIRDPETKIELTPEQAQRFKVAGIPGFQSASPVSGQVPLRMMQWWNEQAASHYLATERLSDLKTTLTGTPLADKVPTTIDFTKPGVASAISRFRFYTSHNSDNLNDPYLALQAMGADKRNPKTGAMEPNPDAKYVDTVAQTFGGFGLLEAAHNQILAQKKTAADFAVIDSVDKANAVLSANPTRFSADQRSSASNFIRLANAQGAAKAGQDARARSIAEGTDVQAMYRFGRNPITGEQLSLTNAPDAMLVNGSGQVVPQDMVSTYKPTAQERQTADTARQVLAISGDLQAAIQKNPALIGPLSGRSKQGLAKIGIGAAEAQTLLDNVSFLQTAATKMHTGRFSNQILDKMGELIKPAMNPDQMTGALASVNAVATRYAQEDKLVTVADLKQMQNQTQQQQNTLHGTHGATQPPSNLTNIQVNPQTHQRIGWNGSAWVDAQTGIGVK